MQMKSSHWIAIAGQIVAIGTMIGGLEHGWHDATTPTFISGVVIQLGTLVAALGGDPIQGRDTWTPEQREAQAKKP